MYFEEDWIPLSALQHYIFCPRQCALNYVEKVWVENYLTAAGRMMHHKTEEYIKESRNDVILEYGVEIASLDQRVFGMADAVEYQYRTRKKEELLTAIPIEYKRGKAKSDESDTIQLCAQALCLEDMLSLHIEAGFLFYFSNREKIEIGFDCSLRAHTKSCIREVHSLFKTGNVPHANFTQQCKSCSMLDVCFPGSAGRGKSVRRYIGQRTDYEENQ